MTDDLVATQRADLAPVQLILRRRVSSVLVLIFACGVIALSGCSGSYEDPAADEKYSKRRSQPLSEKEKILVGRWQGENRNAEWEIQRHADGTCELSLDYGEGDSTTDYRRGIWGLSGRTYFYVDLEANSDVELGVRNSERVVVLEDELFRTVDVGDDGIEVVSTEKKVPGVFHVFF